MFDVVSVLEAAVWFCVALLFLALAFAVEVMPKRGDHELVHKDELTKEER